MANCGIFPDQYAGFNVRITLPSGFLGGLRRWAILTALIWIWQDRVQKLGGPCCAAVPAAFAGKMPARAGVGIVQLFRGLHQALRPQNDGLQSLLNEPMGLPA